ncbi:alpha/beta fold hydrolase [Natroniella sp. ANB-PHB2]|uniref:alpha/beta fold hydrolase n=1 Tax=Natroniella sp. ANB-PHB2 TaxID=3384444 RepID=UPI0038D4F340
MLVEKQKLKLSRPFKTEQGEIIKEPIIAYEEYGKKEGPVIFIAHGGLSNQHAAGKYSKKDKEPGWWDEIIGEGKAIDLNKYRVICANSLGGMNGTSSPLSINPDTGRRYGSDFPEITLIDTVRFHKAFLDELNIDKLQMMAGPSMGSLQSLQMAALYPDFVNSVVAVATAGRMTPSGMAMHHFMINAAKSDPEFNKGNYENENPKLALKLIHQVARLYYTNRRIIEEFSSKNVVEGFDAQKKRSENVYKYLTRGLEKEIKGRDLNCYIRLLEAVNTYDLGRDVGDYKEGILRIKAPLLLINITTDQEFPPVWADEVADILNAKRPGQAEVREIDSSWGHLGCVKEAEVINKHISEFIVDIEN